MNHSINNNPCRLFIKWFKKCKSSRGCISIYKTNKHLRESSWINLSIGQNCIKNFWVVQKIEQTDSRTDFILYNVCVHENNIQNIIYGEYHHLIIYLTKCYIILSADGFTTICKPHKLSGSSRESQYRTVSLGDHGQAGVPQEDGWLLACTLPPDDHDPQYLPISRPYICITKP